MDNPRSAEWRALLHELNQPLTAILSNAQAAQRGLASGTVDPRELSEILADIVADDKRAARIVKQLSTALKRKEHAEAYTKECTVGVPAEPAWSEEKGIGGKDDGHSVHRGR